MFARSGRTNRAVRKPIWYKVDEEAFVHCLETYSLNIPIQFRKSQCVPLFISSLEKTYLFKKFLKPRVFKITLGNKKKSVYLDFEMRKCSEGSPRHPHVVGFPKYLFNPGGGGLKSRFLPFLTFLAYPTIFLGLSLIHISEPTRPY